MLKFFGREDTVRDEEVFNGNVKYSNIEFYTNKDTKTGQDIGRPINNIYQNQFKLISFLEEFVKVENKNEGVFAGSLNNEYFITSDDIVQTTVGSNLYNFVRIPPGISSLSYIDEESDEHTKPTILVNTPTVDIAARQIAKILNMNMPLGKENVTIKYLYGNDSFKAKISRTENITRKIKDYYFGCLDETEWEDDSTAGKKTGAELLSDIYNESDFISEFDIALSEDITRLTIEPFFKITAVALYYVFYDLTDGVIKLSTLLPGNSFLLARVDITNISAGNFAGSVNNTHTLINDKKIISATGTSPSSIEMNTTGGVTVNAASDFIINGNLVVTGDITSSDELVVTDNIITVNYGETGAGVTKLTAGITVDRGTETDYNILFDETNQYFKVGEAGSEQPVATREETPVDGYGVIWNAANSRFESDSSLGSFSPVEEFDYDSQTDFNWSVRDTGQNPITTSLEGINTNRQDLYEYVELLSTEGANYQVAAGASLIGAAGIKGVTPTAKTQGETGNLQQMLEGLLNPNKTIFVCSLNNGTNGYSFTASSWNKVTLNTTITNEIKDCVLSYSEITLEPGIYEVEVFSAGYKTDGQRLRLYDGTTVLLNGVNSSSDSSNDSSVNAVMSGFINLTLTTTFWIEHYSSSGGRNGVAVSSGEHEIYSQIKITQRG